MYALNETAVRFSEDQLGKLRQDMGAKSVILNLNFYKSPTSEVPSKYNQIRTDIAGRSSQIRFEPGTKVIWEQSRQVSLY